MSTPTDNENPNTQENQVPPASQTSMPPAMNNQPPAERFIEYNGEKIQIPENLWDNEKNELNIGAVVKSQHDLRQEITNADKSPKDGIYKVELPETLKDIVEVDYKNPLLVNAMAVAKAARMSPEKFNELVMPYFQNMIDEDKKMAEYTKSEDAKLEQLYGNRKEEMLQRISNFVQNSKWSKDSEALNEIKLWTTSASGVRLLNELIDLQNPTGSTTGSATPGVKLTEDEIFQMMKDPRYENDKSYQDKIQKHWEALYS